ncbi:LANO_0E08064g1_1 [Lachancea nothofagi CBS 11611]|uniref:LANO_0E08064g1_1 n=1 Tax=Lachancea nothofagi CBS 11611 TaxID=1266666 RepID=A0A1G4JUW9_9SACH|nr:LANO_0E08064g1_1 [Lachancea nothofagi CBS 11611]
MKLEKAYVAVVVTAYVYITLAVVALWRFRNDSSGLYYCCTALLAPVAFWLWSVMSWCGAQVFASAKRK